MNGKSKLTVTAAALIALLILTASPARAVDATDAAFKRGLAAYNSGAFTEAAQIWSPLADQGSAIAQSSLGLLYYSGSGVRKDYRRARKLFLEAAKRNVPEAQMFLSLMYRRGDGVRQSYLMSYMWCDIAVSAGHEAASYVRLTLAEYLDGDEVLQAQRLSSEWRQHYLR